MNLDEITLETAQPLVNTLFQVIVDEGSTLEMKLIDVAPFDLPRRPPRGSKQPKRAPFALYFLGPFEPILPQRMYDFRSGTMDLNGLFIVPVGRDEEGTEYEAVFS
ncbi:MAG: hypothetical protein QOE68_1444 [Thermoanaerobaculia bacterium]|jgi:hypothetical protein|nr:hypothetical protein [Thermoanaerobaculia bacterium]